MMGLASPGGFAWLALHEIRLAWRNRPRKGVTRWIGYVLALLYIGFGCFTAWGLRDVAIPASPELMIGVLAGCIVALSFMTAQAIIGSQRTLYESGDLALLFTAPIEPRAVLQAKLLGIAGTIALTYAMLLLPMVVPIAILGHPQLIGVILLLAALALAAAALGIAITLVLATWIGPRAARTFGQILAALLGGAVFLTTQIMNQSAHHGASVMLLFERLRADGLGSTGLSGLPGRAALGAPVPLFILFGGGVLLFLATGAALQRLFLGGYQEGSNRLSRARPTGRSAARLFHAGLFRSIFAKEWRLLLRDPALAFQIVLRLVYLAPLFLVFMRHSGDLPLAPGMAFASVLVAGQMVGSLAWLTVSAEDAPDLLAIAPVAKSEIDLAKLLAAFAMAAPFAILLPIALAFQSPLGALVTVVMTALGGGLAGLIELKLGKPGQRQSFARRRSGSPIAGIVSILIALVFGGAAGVAVYLIG
jgi:ABC-2 type transport system permease protein